MPSDNDLHKAAHKGDLDECKRLIEEPGPGDDPMDVNCAGASDRRPIHRAAGAGHLDICEYLVSKGALVNQPDKSGRTSLHWAAIAGYANVVKYLLDNGCDIMAQTAGSMSSLHGACEAGKVEVVRELLAFVASDEAIRTELTNLKNQDGKTAFDVAVAGKQQAVCQALKDGGDANAASAACVIS